MLKWTRIPSAQRAHRARVASRRPKLGAENLEPRIVLDSTVVFNELMYNPPEVADDSSEWIELYNQLAVDMDISEWELDGGVDYVFPAGTIVPGRGFLLVASDPTNLEAPEGVTVVGPYSGLLDNGGEEVRLVNNDGRLMNTIDYNDGGKWPSAPDGSGASLAKRHALTASEEFENWTSSGKVGGTPGDANFEVVSFESGGIETTELVPAGQPVTAIVPTDGSLGTDWVQTNFDDSGWLTGNAGIGFDTAVTYDNFIGLDLEDQMRTINPTAYMRMDFEVTVDPADMDQLYLQMQYDDGFIAYLNGTEVARAVAPENARWDSRAAGSNSDNRAVLFEDFNITSQKELLNVGTNLLAVHGLNASPTSSDFLISPKFGYVPVPDVVTPTGGPLPIVINEVSPLEGNRFVELANLSGNELNLDGLVLRTTGVDGGDYVFPNTTIAPNGTLVVTEAELGATLADDERLFLYSPDQTDVLDAQPITKRLRGRTADGNWLYPDLPTPNEVNRFAFEDQIVINEIMYHHQSQLRTANTPYADSTEEWIELYNRGTTAVDLSGWEIRDAVRYNFADETMLGAGEYLVVAREPDTLAAEFPGIRIVGPFDGGLSNSSDRISLVDAFSNPADEVRYYESGLWDSLADGGGSSLELKNPFADNSNGSSWAASDESGKASWGSYTASKVSDEPLGLSAQYHELIIGMLDSGEVLIDNLSLTRSGTELLPNGDFEGIPTGEIANTNLWRFIGNHEGTVITDPDDPTNQVLYLNARGAQQHVHDHMEVTFANNARIVDGQRYTISFDAKWVSGSRQLNNRLYFTRAGNTIILDAPQDNGTPGAQNSQFVENLGPSYTEFAHAPILPNPGDEVTVTVNAEDPDGVASMDLIYRVDGEAFVNVPMTIVNGQYTAKIPGQTSGTVVQFYVQGTDTQGAVSTFPADGADSRALYEVNDGQGTSREVETFRVVLMRDDNSTLFSNVNTMSNNYQPGTLVVGDHTVFYDVGVRQIGSRFIRPNSGYKVQLSADNKFLGVHESVRFDIELLDEIIFKQMLNRAGGSSTSMYDDLSYMISPQHSGRGILLNLARYEAGFLSEQFSNGTDGTKFELDDITSPTNPNADGFKTGTNATAQDMRYHGTDPEAYRGQLLIKNNRSKDDFQPIAEFVRVINLNGDALDAAIDDVMDVDLWMRHYATQSFVGNWDTYGFNRPKNLRLYIRPSDGKIIPLYWDADRGNLTDALIYNGGSSRLDEIRNIPRNTRLFWGHMLDLVENGFNPEYTEYWTTHFQELGGSTASRQTPIANRANQARTQAESTIPKVNFEITTNGGNPMTVDDTNVALRGKGWIDVREVRLFGSETPLKVTWIDTDTWEIIVPLSLGGNDITLEAFNFRGERIGASDITVTTTAVQPAVRDQLRISEIHYNPAGEDTTEFVELIHAGAEGSSPIVLDGVRFTDGIDFAFPAGFTLAAGERTVIVSDLLAFEAAYGQGNNVAGQFAQSLRNSGERIELVDDVDAIIHSFSYNDNWYPESDGGGYSLTIADVTQDPILWDSSDGWRLSEDIGGSPGIADNGLLPNAVVINEISNNDTTDNWIEIHNRTDEAIDISNWYLSDDSASPIKYQFAPGTTVVEGGFIVLNQSTSFGNAGAVGAATTFDLEELGGELWLNAADELGELLPYQVKRSYGAAEPDATQGLIPTSDGLRFATLTSDTRGGANQGPVIGPIVINEIHYNPAGDGPEFIEIQNISNAAVSLNDGNGVAWRFTNGIDFTFPVGETLAAGSYAVVIEGVDGGDKVQAAIDFRAANDVPGGVSVFVYEPTSNGSLANGGEELQLARPSASVAGVIVVDEIDYKDSRPWPTGPDGEGPSLSKLAPEPFGNEPSNWGTGSVDGTPGRVNVLVDVTPPTKPTDLVAQATSQTEVALAWTPAVDLESGIDHYIIYRDDEVYGTSPIPFFIDNDVSFELEPVRYQVAAVNGDDLVSNGRSNTDQVGTELVSFQQNVNGYTGASDAQLSESAPDDNISGEPALELDTSDRDGGVLGALLKWEDISIPEGRVITDVWISLNVTNVGDPHNVYQVVRDWDAGEVTWNNATAGQNWELAGAAGATDRGEIIGDMPARNAGPFFWVFSGEARIDLNEFGRDVVLGWLDDPSTNHGILFTTPDSASNNLIFDSQEASSEDNRPSLNYLLAPVVAPLVAGDFTLDNEITADDLSVMCGAIQSGSEHALFDLDGSGGPATADDLDSLLSSLGTVAGDANLDGRVGPADLNVVGLNWSQSGSHLGWASGDFTCDGTVDAADLNQVGRNWNFAAAAQAKARTPRAPLAAVSRPLPTDVVLADVATQASSGRDDFASIENSHDDLADRTTQPPARSQRSSLRARRARASVSSDAAEQIADQIFRGFDAI